MQGWLVALILCCLPTLGQAEAQMRVLTEDSPPMAMIRDGQLSGPAPQFVTELFRRSGISIEQQVYPWARAYVLAQSQPNVALYSLARTPEREGKFYWIGELFSTGIAFYGLASRNDLKLQTIHEAKGLRIGVIRQDVRVGWLKSQGFVEWQPGMAGGLDYADGSDSNYRKLMRGLIDLVPVSDAAIHVYCNKENISCKQFRRVMALPLSIDLYLAVSKGTSPAMVKQLQKTYRQMVDDGTLERQFGPLKQLD